MTGLKRYWPIGLLWLLSGAVQAADLGVKMLADGAALIVVDGEQHMLSAGETSPEGVKLINASRAGAEVSYEGERYTLTLSKRIASGFEQAERAEVRIASSAGGHYRTPGRINGQPVNFLIDTGATAVAMNVHKAKALGINYAAGDVRQVSTANGVARAYSVWLDSVSVGNVTVRQVEAFVIVGASPSSILLGNSYLNVVDMSKEQGVLVLRARH